MNSLTDLGEEIVRVLWLALPVVVAAIVHIVMIKKKTLEVLKTPIDGGASFRGKRVFGDNKTWRGLIVYVVVSMLAIVPQHLWRIPSVEFSGLNYATWSGTLLLGFLLGLGFALGELPNSFLKRQLGIGAGVRGNVFFVILDQVDSLIGCLLLICLIWVPPPITWVVVIGLCTLLHMAVNGVFVCVGLKKSIF